MLNGIKYLISNGGIADTIVVFAYPEAGAGRISAFILDTDGPGIEREDLTAKLGLPTCNTAMFQLTDYAVPAENLLGSEGDGFRIAMATLVSGRLSVAAGCLGVIEDCLHEAAAVRQAAAAARQGDRPASTGAGAHRRDRDGPADHRGDGDPGRPGEGGQRRRAGQQGTVERADLLVAQAKYHASNAACQAADRAIQVFGGRGYSELFRPGRHWKDVRVCRIYEGTDEILKLKIAASVLGKEYAAFRERRAGGEASVIDSCDRLRIPSLGIPESPARGDELHRHRAIRVQPGRAVGTAHGYGIRVAGHSRCGSRGANRRHWICLPGAAEVLVSYRLAGSGF